MPSTLKGLASVFGVATTTIHAWRHGVKLPSAETLELIARKTAVSYDWLATGRGVKHSPKDSYAISLANRIERASPDVRRYIEAILTASENPDPANSTKTHSSAESRRVA